MDLAMTKIINNFCENVALKTVVVILLELSLDGELKKNLALVNKNLINNFF